MKSCSKFRNKHRIRWLTILQKKNCNSGENPFDTNSFLMFCETVDILSVTFSTSFVYLIRRQSNVKETSWTSRTVWCDYILSLNREYFPLDSHNWPLRCKCVWLMSCTYMWFDEVTHSCMVCTCTCVCKRDIGFPFPVCEASPQTTTFTSPNRRHYSL